MVGISNLERKGTRGPLVTNGVKNTVLLLQRLQLLLWHGFDPWLRNFMLWVWSEKKKERKKSNETTVTGRQAGEGAAFLR